MTDTAVNTEHPHINDNSHPHFARIAHALLRIMAGLMFAQHGLQKILGMFGGLPPNGESAPVGTLIWVAGMLELIGGPIIALGIFTRIVAFLLSGEMAVAYFKAAAPHGFWPIANHGELPVLFCFIFFYFAATGAGGYSLQALLRKRGG